MTDIVQALPCLVCGRALANILDPEEGQQPNDGVAFHSYGHYGSAVFDPMDGTSLHVNVCDPCVEEAKAKGRAREMPPRAPRPAMDEETRRLLEEAEPIASWDEPKPTP